MPYDQPNLPLPPDADDQEDVIRAQRPDPDADTRDRDASPLPPDSRGQEDIMSADPEDETKPAR
jgi:hypothetical protein